MKDKATEIKEVNDKTLSIVMIFVNALLLITYLTTISTGGDEDLLIAVRFPIGLTVLIAGYMFYYKQGYLFFSISLIITLLIAFAYALLGAYARGFNH